MNKTMGGSYHNLAALAEAKFGDARQVSTARSPLGQTQQSGSALSLDSQSGRTRWGAALAAGFVGLGARASAAGGAL